MLCFRDPNFLVPTLKFLYKYFYFSSNPALFYLYARQDWGHLGVLYEL